MLEQHEKNGNMGSWGGREGGVYKGDRSEKEREREMNGSALLERI